MKDSSKAGNSLKRLPRSGGQSVPSIGRALSEVRGEIRLQEPMRRHTSIKIGGPADALVVPHDLEDLRRLVRGATQEGIPIFLLGGTNLLVREGGIRGIVVKLTRFHEVACSGNSLYAESGLSFPKVAQQALKAGLSGLEFACGIPGTLGGAIVMNAGTHEGEIAQVLESVRIMDLDGEVRDFPKGDLEFSYRRSKLPKGVIVGALLKLKTVPRDQIREKMDYSLNYRRKTQPLELPNAGCIFQNPAGESAGRIIDELQFKGKRIGDAQVSERHANFIVNRGNAATAEVLALIREIQQRVKVNKGIELKLEVNIVGEDDKAG